MTRTRALAAFLVGLRDQVDERLRSAAGRCLRDTDACIAHGATMPWAQAALRHAMATSGDGPCRVAGNDRGLTAPMAAFANGCAAHAFELDDVHEEAISHPGAVVVPAVRAIGDTLPWVTDEDVRAAIVIGYEAMGRAGIAVGPVSHMLRGFHPTSMSGVVGSAAAAGFLLAFDTETMTAALGLAATFASGTMEFAASGGMTKRLHAGRAAEGGLTAALLAADGVEGPADGLAGRYGFCRIFSDEPRLDLLTGALGERWMIDEITIKPYAACSDIHPLIQATLELRDEHGLVPTDIEQIRATASTKAATQNNLDGTTSVMAAQYSAQWNIAAALIADPTDPATYALDNIASPQIVALQAKVTAVEAAPEFDATYAWKMGGAVEVRTRDGRRLHRHVHGQRGSMHDPLSEEELDAKIARLSSRSGPAARRER